MNSDKEEEQKRPTSFNKIEEHHQVPKRQRSRSKELEAPKKRGRPPIYRSSQERYNRKLERDRLNQKNYRQRKNKKIKEIKKENQHLKKCLENEKAQPIYNQNKKTQTNIREQLKKIRHLVTSQGNQRQILSRLDALDKSISSSHQIFMNPDCPHQDQKGLIEEEKGSTQKENEGLSDGKPSNYLEIQEILPRFSSSKGLGLEFDFIFRKMRREIYKKSIGANCCRLEAGVPLGKKRIYKFYIQHAAPGQIEVGFTTLSHFEKVSCYLSPIYCVRHNGVFWKNKIISEAKVESGDTIAFRVQQDHSLRANIEVFLNNVLVCSGLHFQFGAQLIPAVTVGSEGDIVEIVE